MKRLLTGLATILRRRGQRTPYAHIYDAHGSMYMERYWLLGGTSQDGRSVAERGWNGNSLDAMLGNWISARLHVIRRPDTDRHHHDHPRSFASWVLRGWYLERRPEDQAQPPSQDDSRFKMTCRRAGSWAYRQATDRHTIVEVSRGEPCITLVVWFGRRAQVWGFYPPEGKVAWRPYLGLPDADQA